MVQPADVVRRCEVMLADLPEDLDDPSIEKAAGLVRLPARLDWSDPHPAPRHADPYA